MIKKNPETYNELVLVKNVLKIQEYYNVSQDFIDAAYDFLNENKNASIQCNSDSILFLDENKNTVKSYKTYLVEHSIDGLVVYSSYYNVISHYEPGTSSGGSHGGGSSNNNNNNNNNNH